MKRTPPPKNVRRTRSTGKNIPGNFPNKMGETVQFESETEHLAMLRHDRDLTVVNFTTQPLEIAFWADGKNHTYVPDIKVVRIDGSIEIHEVTLAQRREKAEMKRRENAGRAYCQERGWSYVVQTEQHLPQGSEAANLLALFPFRPACYANEQIKNAVIDTLIERQRMPLEALAEEVGRSQGIPIGRVRQCIAHMIWHSLLQIDMGVLVFDETRFSSTALVLLPKE